MALKNTKIAREIVQTCNRFLSSKPDIPPPYRTQELPEVVPENIPEFRYDVSGFNRSSLIPRANFSAREPERIALYGLHHLQPATYPKKISIISSAREDDVWELHKNSHSRKFKIMYPTKRGTVQPKFSLITEKFRNPMNIVSARRYSTSPFLIVSRHFAKKKDTGEKCEKKKKKCQIGPCPPIPIDKHCEKSKGSHCEHFYIDPKCKKKMAPYPSYSETCASQYEDDPSECFQCPWEKCGGIDAIKPPKRSYHTSSRPCSMMTMTSSHLLPTKIFDARKKPCKAPPPKCGEKKRKPKDEGCPDTSPRGKKKKKCNSNWTNAYALWSDKEEIIPTDPWIPLEMIKEELRLLKDPKDIRCKFPFDKRQADYEYLKKKPCSDEDPKCKRTKYKRVPDGCDPDADVRRCISDLRRIVYMLGKKELKKECPKGKPQCPGKQKPKCPDVDHSINITLELAKEHDKGHPPPCKEKKKESQHCPKKSEKPRYKIQRDIFKPYYRKNPKPYPEDTER